MDGFCVSVKGFLRAANEDHLSRYFMGIQNKKKSFIFLEFVALAPIYLERRNLLDG